MESMIDFSNRKMVVITFDEDEKYLSICQTYIALRMWRIR